MTTFVIMKTHFIKVLMAYLAWIPLIGLLVAFTKYKINADMMEFIGKFEFFWALHIITFVYVGFTLLHHIKI